MTTNSFDSISASITLPKHIKDDMNGLTYTLCGDYYLPDLGVENSSYIIGRWGMMHKDYLEKNRPGLYTRLLLSGTLDAHLRYVDEQASCRYNTLMTGYRRCRGMTANLKQRDQIRWVQLMNLAKHEAEANTMDEIIYE